MKRRGTKFLWFLETYGSRLSDTKIDELEKHLKEFFRNIGFFAKWLKFHLMI